jgi:hypothetical protein
MDNIQYVESTCDTSDGPFSLFIDNIEVVEGYTIYFILTSSRHKVTVWAKFEDDADCIIFDQSIKIEYRKGFWISGPV